MNPMRLLGTALVAFTAVIALVSCAVPEDDGTTAADRSEVNSKDDKAGSKDKAGPKETAAQENARESAESYLDYSPYSRKGLIKQLKFEGYSTKDATYGVDAQNANWKRQASASAEAYLDSSSYSRAGLIDQLVFEGFTREQAEHGVNKVGLR